MNERRLPFALVYDRADAESFSKERPAARSVCALSPAARVALARDAIPCIDGLSRYGDCAHAQTIVKRERLRARWQVALEPLRPTFAEWHMLDIAFVTLFNGFDRIRRIAGPDGPWLVRVDGVWTRHEERAAASLAMTHHIMDRYWHSFGNFKFRPPPLPWLYRALRAALILAGRRRAPSWVATRSDHPLGLERALARTRPGLRQWHMSCAEDGAWEYARLVREMWRSLAGAFQIQLRAVPRRGAHIEKRFRQALECFPDPDCRALLGSFSAQIFRTFEIAAGAEVEFSAMLGRIRPAFMLSSEISDGLTAALFSSCGEKGVARTIASHNSFAPVGGGVNALSLRDQIGHQYADGRAEAMLFWTPSAYAAASGAFPGRPLSLLSALPPTARAEARTPGPFMVLHASNCLRFFSRADWIYENVDEFVAGAVALIGAGLTVDGTAYVLRTKVRRYEMDEATLRAMLPPSERVEIAFRHTRPFAEDLARADLLVAFRSTTIMQALYARKPVLLWGITPRYRELNGRETPPTSGDRAAVYSVRRAEALGPMLAGIRNAHRGAPLTDEELAPYLVPPGAMTVDQWACTCLAPRSA
ncbi:MAG: hypothetical protein FJX36_11265 [Alphaproteobacteria bacterium]|nr:hypothetical protein [Alphaproteobacteria bacterium]